MQHEIEIDKPLKDVYAAFRDPDNLPRWLEGLQRTEQISGQPGEVGSVVKQIYLERGRIVEMIETITAHESERLFAGTLEAPGMSSTLRVAFEDRGQRTGMRFSGDFEGCTLIMKLMMPFMRAAVVKRQAADLQTFKRLVEAGELQGRHARRPVAELARVHGPSVVTRT